MLLVIDNYDSFTFNLVQMLGELGADMRVYRNDELTPEQAETLHPSRLIISPGPCDPDRAGYSLATIAHFAGRIPLFGVCLGHQCIGQHFGGAIVRAERLMHGKTSPVTHRGTGLFAGLPNPFSATRYHSLLIAPGSMGDDLEVNAETQEGEIMGIQHKSLPIWGVQFHPESLATEEGRKLLENFLKL